MNNSKQTELFYVASLLLSSALLILTPGKVSYWQLAIYVALMLSIKLMHDKFHSLYGDYEK